MAELIPIILYCGIRPVRKVVNTGEFFCPTCVQSQPFKKKELWTYCHLYYIPLVPEDHLVDYVKCSGCKNRFDAKVLENGLKDVQAALNTAMLRAMIRIMAADGVIETNEISAICKIYEKRTGTKLERQDVLVQYVIMKAVNKGDIRTDLKPFAKRLSAEEKDNILAAVVAVSLADGDLDREEAKLITAAGEVLGVELSRVKQIIKDERNRGEEMKYAPDAIKTNKIDATVDEDRTHTETEAEGHDAIILPGSPN